MTHLRFLMIELVQIETRLTALIEWSKTFESKTYEQVVLEQSDCFPPIESEPSVSAFEPLKFLFYLPTAVALAPWFVRCWQFPHSRYYHYWAG